MIKGYFSSLLMIISLANFGNAANVLAMVPMPFFSHTNNFMPIFKELAQRGHNVTVVSPFPQKTPVPNLTDVVVPNIFEKIELMPVMQNMIQNLDSTYFQLVGLWIFGIYGMPLVLETEQIQRFIKDTDSKYDLIITETWFIQEPLVAFGHKFNAPVISIMPAFFFPMAAHLTGNHLSPASIPLNRLGFTDHMTFIERVENFFYYSWDIIVGQLYYLKKQDAIMREYFKYPGSENLPALADMLRDTSMTLLDYNSAIGYPAPLQKNVIPFGGINIKRPDPLNEDLQKIMDNAKDGVIYFSFGSHSDISSLKSHVQEAIFSALGKFKNTVLIKLDDPAILENYTYTNMVGRKWFPQSSILAHPNCKVFITHGGIHGLMEGVYNAVPFVAIPIHADQKFNARVIELTGIGIVLEKNTITEEKLSTAIQTVLNDPSYQSNAKTRSTIFKDTPMDTMDNVIYWIEYVIRHKGAPHLRPAVLDLHWHQHLMLDVIAFYLLLLVLVIYIIKMILRKTFRCMKWIIFRSKDSDKSRISKSKSKKE